jgi:hypothetical protein
MTKYDVLAEIEADIDRIKQMQNGLLEAYKTDIGKARDLLNELNKLHVEYETLLKQTQQL